jgi:adenylate cyclase
LRHQTILPILGNILFFTTGGLCVATTSSYFLERFARIEFIARRQNDLLLGQFLPPVVAENVKKGVRYAKNIPDAGVLFADLVDFTAFAAKRSPMETVNTLNILFTRFDEIAKKYRLEKIKTIGDSYMVTSGLAGEKDHLENLAFFALEIRHTLKLLCNQNNLRLRLRIGIHCGPLVAGAIGSDKPMFDVWGDTVNIAARIEQEGLPDEINCSGEVEARLRKKFYFSNERTLDLKGAGSQKAFLMQEGLPSMKSDTEMLSYLQAG